MSYFDFINQGSSYKQQRFSDSPTPSTFLPVSIADELYESQTVGNSSDEPHEPPFDDSIRNQPSVTASSQHLALSSPSSNSQGYSKGISSALSTGTSVFGFINQTSKQDDIQSVDDLGYSNGMSSRQSPALSTGASVFGFINRASKQDDIQSVDDLVFASKHSTILGAKFSPKSTFLQHQQQSTSGTKQQEIGSPMISQLASPTSRKTIEMERLHEESNWKRAKAGKQHQQQLVQQIYEQRKVIIAEIQHNQALLRSNSEKKQQAKDEEDYDKLDKLIKQRQLVNAKLDRLKFDVWETTTEQLHTAWMKMSALTRVEGECASKVAHIYQEAKDERQQQFTQYNVDMKRKHDGLLENINAARSDIESGKSQLAFDLDFWKQAKSELDEKMAEAVQGKTRQKNELMAMVDSTDEEIATIKKKLEEMIQKRQAYILEINNLEHDIGRSLLPYQPEIDAQEKEKQEMDSRKRGLEQQSNDLDQRNAALQQKIERCHQYEDQGWKEMNDMDDAIKQATMESQTNTFDADNMMTVLNQYLLDRDRAIKEIGENQKKAHDDIKQLQNQIEQQQNEYNTIQQQMDDDDTRLNLSKMQKMKMARQKSRAVEQEQYQQAAKWQEQIRQIDLVSDQDMRTLAHNQTKLDKLDLDLKTSREQLHGLLVKNDTQERESVEATMTLLDNSETVLTQVDKTFWILDNELDGIRNWKSYLEQYLTTLG